MQKIFIGIFTIIVLSSFCINLYHVNEDGEEFVGEYLSNFPIFYQSFNTTYYQNFINNPPHNSSTASHEVISDVAAALMKLGNVEEATEKLEGLYEEHPNEYNIIANLATAYELSGEVDKALALIKKALSINATSHRGSEWFHVKVLEAKQKIRTDKDWLKTHKVLDIDPALTSTGSINQSSKINEILNDIGYQLAERIPFSSKPDPILANILNEYGDAAAKISVQTAYVIYGMGIAYDENNQYDFKKKKRNMAKLAQRHGLELPNIKTYFPDEQAFSDTPNKFTLGPRIHKDRLTTTINHFLQIAQIVGIGVFGIIIFFLGRFLLKKRKKAKS